MIDMSFQRGLAESVRPEGFTAATASNLAAARDELAKAAPGLASRKYSRRTASGFSKLLMPRFDTMTSTDASGRSSADASSHQQSDVVEMALLDFPAKPVHGGLPGIHRDVVRVVRPIAAAFRELDREKARPGADVQDREP
jgi:hypothetical protein